MTIDAPASDGGMTPGLASVGRVYAGWLQRVVATVLDNAVLAGTAWLAMGPGAPWLSLAPVLGVETELDLAVPPASPGQWWLVCVFLLILATQAWTGYTPGKLVVGIAVVRADSGRPAGFVRTLLRLVVHLVDAILLLGYLRPLWHPERRTFADSLAGTVVVWQTPALPLAWRRAVGAAAIVVCVFGLGFGCAPVSGGASGSGSSVTCRPVAAADGPESAHTTTVTPLPWEEWEQRLWVRRDAPPELTLFVDWGWTGPDAEDPRSHGIEITASGSDGQAVAGSPWVVHLDGSMAGVAGGGPGEAGRVTSYEAQVAGATAVHTATVETSRFRLPEGVTSLDVTTRLLAYEDLTREVATCTASVDVSEVPPSR